MKLHPLPSLTTFVRATTILLAASFASAIALAQADKPQAADAGKKTAAGSRYVIWKMDDVRGVNPGFQRLADWFTEKKMKAGFGIICNSLEKDNPAYFDWIKKYAVENGGVIEFWHHGYDHKKLPDQDGKTNCSEFKGPDYASQHAHLEKSSKLLTQKTGLVFHAFGSPFNAADEVTVKAMEAMPDLKIWLYGPSAPVPGKLVLGRTLNLEATTGKVAPYDEFLKAYQKRKPADYLVLQGHPSGWSAESIDSFQRIAEMLAAEGWKFVTPSEYLALQKGK